MNWVQATVAAAPGGPSHVLLSDVVAEHIPGCNMAFHQWAFNSVGGFDTEYRKAGDDVDFCWRLQTSGQVIAFSPAAIVWHYRRFTLTAFRKQQEGYGEAESMLRFKHLIFFGPTGTIKWKGQIYGAPRFTWLVNKPIIYHGVFGQGLFQSIYPAPQSDVAAYLRQHRMGRAHRLHFRARRAVPSLRIVPFLMFGGTFLVALSYMLHARIEPEFDTIRARLLVAFLALMQPLGPRLGALFHLAEIQAHTAGGHRCARGRASPPRARAAASRKLDFWNEKGRGARSCSRKFSPCSKRKAGAIPPTPAGRIGTCRSTETFWSIKLRTVTEYHGGPKCLTRVRLALQARGDVCAREQRRAFRAAVSRLSGAHWDLGLTGLVSKRRLWHFCPLDAGPGTPPETPGRRFSRRFRRARAGLERVFGQKSKPVPQS